jgi:hypothetical protein
MMSRPRTSSWMVALLPCNSATKQAVLVTRSHLLHIQSCQRWKPYLHVGLAATMSSCGGTLGPGGSLQRAWGYAASST